MRRNAPGILITLLGSILATSPSVGAEAEAALSEERLALRKGWPLAWAEALRQRSWSEADGEEPRDSPVRDQRDWILGNLGSPAVSEDAEQCAELIRDHALNCRSRGPELQDLRVALEQSLSRNLWDSLPSESTARVGFEEAWLIVGLRHFDAGMEQIFVDEMPYELASLESLGPLKNVLDEGLGSDPLGDLSGLTRACGPFAARVKAEVYSFVVYTKWAGNSADGLPVLPTSGGGEPTNSKLKLARLFVGTKHPGESGEDYTGVISAAIGELRSHGCRRWVVDGQLARTKPDGTFGAFTHPDDRTFFEEQTAWFATRAFLLDMDASDRHEWWYAPPDWWAEREDLDAQIEELLGKGDPQYIERAFKLVQQAKLLPFKSTTDDFPAHWAVEYSELDSIDLKDLREHFARPLFKGGRPFDQHAYVEYYWGPERRGVFYIVSERGQNEKDERSDWVASDLKYQELSESIVNILLSSASGETVPSNLCPEIFNVAEVPKPGHDTDTVHLCDVICPKILIAPDGPLWNFPFETVLQHPDEDRETDYKGNARITYTPTAAALSVPGGDVKALDWCRCWWANYARAAKLTGTNVAFLPPSWLSHERKLRAFPIVLPGERVNPETLGRLANYEIRKDAYSLLDQLEYYSVTLSWTDFWDLRSTNADALRRDFGTELALVLVETGKR